MSNQDWAKRFDEAYTPAESPTRQAVMREVLGDEYPEGLDANSFVTVSELHRYARDLRVGGGDLLVDAACGRRSGPLGGSTDGRSAVGVRFRGERGRARAHAGRSGRSERARRVP